MATLFFLLSQAAPGEASVRVIGMNSWLASAAERSLNAVLEHIPKNETDENKGQLVEVVANRLLTGYSVEDVRFDANGDVSVKFKVSSNEPEWDTAIISPNLSPPVDAWFASDTAGIAEKLRPQMRGTPIEALSWGDADLKRTVEELCGERLPGWRISLMVRGTGSAAILEISFVPEQPLTLAVTSTISSTSIPAMLHSNLRDALLAGFAPVIGVPVAWMERHSADFVEMGRAILEDESLVEHAKASPEMNVKMGPVTDVQIDLESRRYAAWVWMAVYAGADDKYPEVGVHFGRRAQIFPRWDMELYTELIVPLDDFSIEARLGMRWSPWRNVWLGGEWSDAGDVWWARASLDSRLRRPYGWIRYSEEGDANAAVGYRINDFISVEVHYDSRSDSPWNVRALVNL
ncbi:MAG: hypothetical protein LBS45_04585 [Synergistaceae bacterium]|nr:hypothetical protein [Synergistaceae bacterium]